MNPQISAEMSGAALSPLKHWWESIPLPSSFPFPDPPVEPTPQTHRFYLCQASKDRTNAMMCQQGTQAIVEAQMNSSSIPASQGKIVTIKRGCPEFFDNMVLSRKLGVPVAMGMRLS